MGILNVTPDSFSDGGRYLDPDDASARGSQMLAQGADIVDVGGESSRPGAAKVMVADELVRTIPVVTALVQAGVPVSIDTTKAQVARAAIGAGATMVNDISAGRFEPEILRIVADSPCRYVVMHMLGEPATMQAEPTYGDVFGEVAAFLEDRLEIAERSGIDRNRLVADPGIGFGKSVAHNIELLARIDELVERLDVPVMIGTSRKSFLGAILGGVPENDRDDATLGTVIWALEAGVSIVRVHEVTPARHAVDLIAALQNAQIAA